MSRKAETAHWANKVHVPEDGLGDKPSVAERVEFIAYLMSTAQWVRGKTGRVLANRWGISVSAAEGHASEASRLVRSGFDAETRQEHAARAVASLEHIASEAMRRAAMSEDRDGAAYMKAATDAIKQKAAIVGPPAEETAGRSVTVTVERPDDADDNNGSGSDD